MTLTKILTILCIALFMLLGIFLFFSKRKRSRSNRILAIFFWLWGLNFLDGFLLLDGFYLHYPSLALWEDPLVFLYGPVIYFYCRSLTGLQPFWKPLYFLHLIPMVLLQLLAIVFYHTQSTTYKLEIINRILNLEQPPEIFILTLLIFAHILGYIISSGLLIRRYTEHIKNNYSTVNLSWLNNVLRSLVYLVALSLFVSITQFYGEPLYFEIGLLVLMASISVFISSILFRAFEEPQLFVYQHDGDKYRTSNLSTTEIDEIAAKIKGALDKKIYLDPETTISDLAEVAGVPARQVSQVINQKFNQNFFELINSYRIEAAQKLMQDPDDPKITILEVMYKAGYNSKSSFNTQFKKFTGLTPSEFKRLNQ